MTLPVRFKPGRKPPHSELTHPRMHARDVLQGEYTGNVPAAVNWYGSVAFPMDLNDQLGDCTIADEAHAVGVFTKFGQGAEAVLSSNDVLVVYERVGGYVPGDMATDQGCVIQDVLNDWRKNGIGNPPHKILAFFQVNHTDLAEMKACTWLFLGVTLGVNLPQSALDQFQAGQIWDYNRGANNRVVGGHDVRVVGYNADGTWDLVTWGTVQKATWAWIQSFTEEAWAEADEEIVNGNAVPNGLNVAALNAAFTQLTGQPGPFIAGPTPIPPGPSPTPTPTPPPAPVPVSAADQALAAAIPASWLNGYHVGNNEQVCKALQAWFAATGLQPAVKH